MGNKSSSYDVQNGGSPNNQQSDPTSTDRVIQKENTEPSAPPIILPSAPVSAESSESAVDVPSSRGSLISGDSSSHPPILFTSQIEYNVQPIAQLATDLEQINEPPLQKLFRIRPLPEQPLDKEPTEDRYD